MINSIVLLRCLPRSMTRIIVTKSPLRRLT
jgi:hypothetical protein